MFASWRILAFFFAVASPRHYRRKLARLITALGGGGGDSHMKQTGMLVGNFELIPNGDHRGVAQGFCDP